MTREEREKRWQEIFDHYDHAMAEYHQQMTQISTLAPLLNQMIAKWDAQADAARRIAEATMAANRAALALYREKLICPVCGVEHDTPPNGKP